MIRIALFMVAFIMGLSAARASDLKIARFDANLTFESYERVKDLAREISDRRNVTGPGTAAGENEEFVKLAEETTRLTDQLANCANQIKHETAGTAKYEHLEQEQEILTLRLQVIALTKSVKGMERENEMALESRRTREEVINEIFRAARLLASEDGYALIVPYGTFQGEPGVIAGDKCEDVTQELIRRLNERYRGQARKSDTVDRLDPP